MPLHFQTLASGSKGNAILVASPTTQILIDAGLSGRELTRRLDQTPVRARDLKALVVSHEHNDHIRGLGVMSRRFDLPVYLSHGTLENLPLSIGELAHTQVFQPGHTFRIGDLKISAFSVSHDAQQPVGFVIEQNDTRLGICTDLGFVTQLVKSRLRHCHGLILEANHDPQMLINGPYPPFLKQRIRSRHGHLSNEQMCTLLEDLLRHEHLQAVVLAHLSETNNHPEKVNESLHRLADSLCWEQVCFQIASQNEVSPEFKL